MTSHFIELDDAVAAESQLRSSDRDRWNYIQVDNFVMDENGLQVQISKGSGNKATAEFCWVSAPFEVLDRVRDPSGYGWAKRIRWLDPDGRPHECAVPDADLHGELSALASNLAAQGLMIARDQHRHLAAYLNRVDVKQRLTSVKRTGWHETENGLCFVLPEEVINGSDGEMVILEGTSAGHYEVKGSLDGWKQGVGQLMSGHSRGVFAVSIALAGPLLRILGVDGGGIHFVGPSSCGKTTIQRAAASVWGRGSADPGFLRSWRATANANEAAAALVSDTLLALDEIGVAEGKDAAAAIYQLAAGVGKGRSHRDGSLRSPQTWRVLVLSTGEIPIATKISEDRGRRSFAGQNVRLIDIFVDAGQGFGAFDNGGSEGDASKLADSIKQAATSAYGTAGPELVRKLIDAGINEVRDLAEAMISDFIHNNVPREADGQVKRVAERIALIGVAGEIAREWGIVPWQPREAMAAACRILHEWIAARGGTKAAEEREAISQVRRFFEAHGETRFDLSDQELDVEPDMDAPKVYNRAGWRRGYGSWRRWYVLPEMWKSEVCQGLDPTATARVLYAHGMLERDEIGKKFVRTQRTPSGLKRVYVVTAAILDEGTDGT